MRVHGIVIPILLLVGFAVTAPRSLAESPSYLVAGRILSDAGEPLAGVEVNGYSSSSSGASANAFATTGKDGAYAFMLPGGKATISVSYNPWRAYDSRSFELAADAKNVDFKLKTPPPKTAIIEGRILDASGNPIAGAQVSLGYGCCYAYADKGGTTAPTPTTVEPTESNVSNGSSGGTTSSGAIARPIMPPCCGDEPPVTTGNDGAYRFATYEGAHDVSASAKGYATARVTVQSVAGQTVKADLKLERVPASDAHLKGRVLDATTGLPVRGAQVSWNSMQWGRSNWTTTSANGSYDFWTLPGWGQISAYAYKYDYPLPMVAEGDGTSTSDAKPIADRMPPQPDRTYYPSIETLKATTGASVHDIKITAKPLPTIALTGYAVDPDAKTGVPGAQVSVWNADTGEGGSATADKTGSFRILVAPGHYTISAWAENHLGGAASFTVKDGVKAHRQDVPLPAGTPMYVPCEDCPVVYATMEGKAVSAESSPSSRTAGSGTASNAPASRSMTPQPGGLDESLRTASSNAYAGSGGGLPTYSPDTSAVDAARQVPGASVAWLALALGFAFVLTRQRP